MLPLSQSNLADVFNYEHIKGLASSWCWNHFASKVSMNTEEISLENRIKWNGEQRAGDSTGLRPARFPEWIEHIPEGSNHETEVPIKIRECCSDEESQLFLHPRADEKHEGSWFHSFLWAWFVEWWKFGFATLTFSMDNAILLFSFFPIISVNYVWRDHMN